MQLHIETEITSLDWNLSNLIFNGLVEDGYCFPIKINFKKQLLTETIQKLKSTYGGQILDFSLYANRNYSFFISDTFAIAYTPSGKASILAKTHNIILDVLNKFSDYISRHDDQNTVIHVFFQHGATIMRDEIRLADVNDDRKILSDLYPSVDIEKLSEEFKNAQENILILYGGPGVGKTTFLRYLLQSGVYKKIAYVKDEAILLNGEFWSTFADNDSGVPFDALVLDDLDNLLEPRAENRASSFINNLLSFSDGVLKTNCKIIITTNQALVSIDPALIRAGRCFDLLILPPLTKQEALFIWVNTLKMEEKTFHERFGELEVVTQASLMSEYSNITTSTQRRQYIKNGDQYYSIATKLDKLGIRTDHSSTGFGRRQK